MAELLEDILRKYAEAKIQAVHIKNYNGANLAYNHASDIAEKLKLSEKHKSSITPFPAPSQEVTIVGGGETSQETERRQTSEEQRRTSGGDRTRGRLLRRAAPYLLAGGSALAGVVGYEAVKAAWPNRGDRKPTVATTPIDPSVDFTVE